jgi:hypothetical protein
MSEGTPVSEEIMGEIAPAEQPSGGEVGQGVGYGPTGWRRNPLGGFRGRPDERHSCALERIGARDGAGR